MNGTVSKVLILGMPHVTPSGQDQCVSFANRTSDWFIASHGLGRDIILSGFPDIFNVLERK